MMGDVHRTAASPSNIDRLGNCVQGVPRFAPHVGGVYAPIRGRDPAEFHEFVGIGKAPRRVDEPARETNGAALHLPRKKIFHELQLAGCCLPVLKTQSGDPQGTVCDMEGQVGNVSG